MAWPMPPPGQWNPGFAVTPDMNMASYTPEQWALMQQQNWQQWAQWQQQYAQWQNQYGDKYTQQFQAMPALTSFPPPPLTSAVPPPAPPPPEKPPPPPPHENDQPLYGNPKIKAAPVKGPDQSKQNLQRKYNDFANAGNKPNASHVPNTYSETQPQGSSVNSEALKKLAEEERLFDIQFKKWEEEIQKWKKENVDHPDKQAYKEYEQKFEACRAQLLERRNQMKEKRARLMGNVSQGTKQIGNVSGALPPHELNTHYSQSIQKSNVAHNVTSATGMQYSSQKYNASQQPILTSNLTKNNSGASEVYRSAQSTTTSSSFLPTSRSKSIPGLDLVPEGEKPNSVKKIEVVDITDEDNHKNFKQNPQTPDYFTISKGINNILGDEKIMNILSMMSHQKPIQKDVNKINSEENRQDSQQWSDSYNNYKNQQNTVNYSNNQGQNTNQNTTFSNATYNNYTRDGYRQNPQQHYYEGQSQFGNVRAPIQNAQPRPLMQNATPHVSEFYNAIDMNNVEESTKTIAQPPKPKWVHEPLFAPSIIVDYEHKPLRLKACDFIEPVHMFDYNHKSKDNETSSKKDFEKEVDDLFLRKPSRTDDESWKNFDRNYERRIFKDDIRERSKLPAREENDIYNRRGSERYDDRRRDDRDRYIQEDHHRRDRGSDYERSRESRDFGRDREYLRDRDFGRDRDVGRDRDSGRDRDMGRDRDRDRDRNLGRDRFRDRRDEFRNRSHSRDKDNRKREHSRERDSQESLNSKKSRETREDLSRLQPPKPQHVVMIDDLLELPGRTMRPEKIVIILRGPPGSGKSYLAKLIRDKEAEHGGTVRIMSIDDYFMQEGEIEEKDPITGKVVKKPSLKYEYDVSLEESYINSLKRAFKRSITDGYFTFLIYDSVNDQLKSYADIWNFSRQNGFQVYICTMDMDAQACFKRNIHNRSLEDIEGVVSKFFPTPTHHIQLDATTLLQNASIPDVHMEDADDVTMEDSGNTEVESSFTSKWEKMDDAAQLARLDGTSKPLRPSQLSMEDYLQLDEWKPNKAKPGKKTVRWADIEERREQEKMRAIGFVVGQTDWTRMTDPTMGSSALTQTKYIERVRRS